MRAPLALALLLAACSVATIDRSKPVGEPTVEPLENVPVRGAMIELCWTDGCVDGELLAVDDAFWLLHHDKVVVVPRNAVREGLTVEAYRPSGAGLAAGIAGVGALTTLSHGWVLVFSAPAWLLAGGIAMGVLASQNDFVAEQQDFDKLYQFARFPQGPPEALRGTAAAHKAP